MRLATACFVGITSLVTATELEAETAFLPPILEEVHGYLFDDTKGVWAPEDLLDAGYVPFNNLSVPLLLVVTVDFGKECVVLEPSSEEARAIASGERPPSTRASACEKPAGAIIVTVKYGDRASDIQRVSLARFFVGYDGRVHVPLLFYRRQQCLPLEIAVRTSAGSKSLVKKVEFTCHE